MDLVCTKCGGPLPTEAARIALPCPYCGTTSVPPPQVIEHFIGRSGPISSVAGPAEPPPLTCPRCAGYLTEKRVREAVLAGCKGCGGVWLDAATVSRLQGARDEELTAAARRFDGELFAPPDQQVAIACPVCRHPLRRFAIAGTTHSVDVCDEHGTWFDRATGDELEMFVTAFEDARAGVVGPHHGQAGGAAGGFFTKLFRS